MTKKKTPAKKPAPAKPLPRDLVEPVAEDEEEDDYDENGIRRPRKGALPDPSYHPRRGEKLYLDDIDEALEESAVKSSDDEGAAKKGKQAAGEETQANGNPRTVPVTQGRASRGRASSGLGRRGQSHQEGQGREPPGRAEGQEEAGIGGSG